ncbi:MAG: FAD-binding oxidoreductase, partial [Bradyrhizobium sp.]
MITRRRFLRTAAASAMLPLAKLPRARAELRTVLNDASRLNPTPVAKHVVITKPATDDLIARLRAELKEAAAAKRPV